MIMLRKKYSVANKINNNVPVTMNFVLGDHGGDGGKLSCGCDFDLLIKLNPCDRSCTVLNRVHYTITTLFRMRLFRKLLRLIGTGALILNRTSAACRHALV
jgi:hypothetical protein